MNYSGIVEHAIDVVRRHRALWILGLLWALVGGAGGAGSYGNVFSYTFEGGDTGAGAPPELGRLGDEMEQLGDRLGGLATEQWIAIAAAVCFAILVLWIVTAIVRYVLQAGIYRSLDQLDAVGLPPTVRGAWHAGWHRRTWRLFVQDLIVYLPLFVVGLLTAAMIALPLLFMGAGEAGLGGEALPVFAILGSGGMFCCWCCFWLVVSIALWTVVKVLQELWWRAAVLDDQDFVTAMGTSWRLARRNAKDLAIMWVLMFVIGLAWMLVTFAVVVAAALVAALVAGVPAYLLFLATDALLWPLVWGIPVGMLVFGLPVTFASGIFLMFTASVWTQVYRYVAGPLDLPPAPSSDLPDALPAPA